MKLPDEVVSFFRRQHLTVVSSVDGDGFPHNSCKGIVDITKNGKVYLLDLYKARTFKNLKINHRISIMGVDEHKFSGYCLKGSGKIVKREKLTARLLKAWDERIAGRITQRLLKEMRGEKGHKRHTEASLPKPQYLIEMNVAEIIDLTPAHLRLKEEGNEA